MPISTEKQIRKRALMAEALQLECVRDALAAIPIKASMGCRNRLAWAEKVVEIGSDAQVSRLYKIVLG